MNERDLGRALRDVELPRPDRERALAVVRAAFADRERVSWPRRHVRSLALTAAAAAVVAGALSPPGLAVLGSLRDAVGRKGVKRASPALVALPTSGRLLVQSPSGPWVVQADGSRRLLGSYRDSAWSPHGLFVAVARKNELLAVEASGHMRWALARRDVRFPRWAGTVTDTRIAYLAGNRLRVVAGDGTHDRELCGGLEAAQVPPAWKPGRGLQLAYVSGGGRVEVVDTETCAVTWRSPRLPALRLIDWSADGTRLAIVTAHRLIVYAGPRRLGTSVRGVVTASFAPASDELAVVQAGRLLLFDAFSLRHPPRRIFAAAGHFDSVAWSPDGRWLLLSWPAADQWLFLGATGKKVLAYSNVTEQFGGRAFPRLRGWCC